MLHTQWKFGTLKSHRFRASYIDINDSRVTANLSIDPVLLEDTAKHFYLEASNEHGRLEYAFALELTPDPTEATYDPIQVGAIISSESTGTFPGCKTVEAKVVSNVSNKIHQTLGTTS